jgi:DNA-binding response OmpR family regulator
MAAVHRSVLVVEDDPEINELVGAYMQLCGFEYRPALTGGAALRDSQSHPPVAVILDLMLPDVDGFEVCRQMRKRRELDGVPIIILSTLNAESDIQRGLACGANAYLTKPFDPDQLMNTLRTYAERQSEN